jgi:16S rRNA (cytidine1402-2'-O)-methyltransferase
LKRLSFYPETLLFYEAPHRIGKTLGAMREVWGNRQAVLARELTKRYEEFIRGSLGELLDWVDSGEIRGEFCIVVEGAAESQEASAEAVAWWNVITLSEHVDHYVANGMTTKEAIKQTADDRGLVKREVYNHYHREEQEKTVNACSTNGR